MSTLAQPESAARPAPQPAPFRALFSGDYRWTTITIMAGTVVGSMDTYIVNTSMPRVLAELGEPQFYAWVTSAFVLAQVVGLSVAGAWKDRAGLKTPFLITVAAFGVGSLLCALAPSMHVLVLSRAFQGLSGGGLNALGFAAAAAYPEAVRIRMLSLISGVWGVVALSAPLLGGLITDSLGWRWVFLVNLPIAAVVIALGWCALQNASGVPNRRAIPVVRALLLAIAVAGVTAAPSATPVAAVPFLVVGIAAAIAFGRAELRAAVPVIPLDAWLGRGPVGSSLRASMLYVGAYAGAGVFLPLYLVQLRGESTTEAGAVLGLGGFAWTLGSLYASTRTGPWPRRLALLGALLIAFGAASVAAQAAFGNLPLSLIYVSWVAAGTGVGLGILHLVNWSLVYSPASQSGTVSAAVQTMRLLGSASVGALLGALLNAIGTDPAHLQTAIVAIFGVTALIALYAATWGGPKIPERSLAD